MNDVTGVKAEEGSQDDNVYRISLRWDEAGHDADKYEYEVIVIGDGIGGISRETGNTMTHVVLKGDEEQKVKFRIKAILGNVESAETESNELVVPAKKGEGGGKQTPTP